MTITQVITALPDAPDPAIDPPSVFSQKAAASVLAQKGLVPELNAFATQVNATADKVNADAALAFNFATAASSAAATVVGMSEVAPWVSGATYAQNVCAISQVNFQAYRRKVAGAGAIDPANDSTNWVLIVGNATNGAFVPVPLNGSVINPIAGNYFTSTVSGATTFTIGSCPSDGYSFTLKVTFTGGSITFPSNVYVPGNLATTLVVGKVYRFMFVTEDRGAHWAMVAASNFDF